MSFFCYNVYNIIKFYYAIQQFLSYLFITYL